MLSKILEFTRVAFLFVFVLSLVSCEKSKVETLNQSLDERNITFDEYELKQGDHRRQRFRRYIRALTGGACFNINYPVSISFPNGSTGEASNDQELIDAYKTFFQDNGPEAGKPTLDLPYSVSILATGDVFNLTQPGDLETLKEICPPPHLRDRCYRYLFPISIDFPNGSSLSVDSYPALRMTIRDWKENNPESEEKPVVAFPFDVQLEDESIVTIAHQEELDAVKESCDEE